jgi:hypothetical protein
MDSAVGLEGSKGWGVVSCKEMGEAPVCGVGQALKDIRAERGERRRGRVERRPFFRRYGKSVWEGGRKKNYAKILHIAFCIPVKPSRYYIIG